MVTFIIGAIPVDCSEKNKGIRASVVLKYATDYLKTKPFSSRESYEHFVTEMKNVLAENASLLKSNILIVAKQLLTLKDRLERTKTLLIGDEDESIKALYREDLKKIENEIKEKEKHEKKLKKVLSEGKDTVLTYEEFIELMEKLPLLGLYMKILETVLLSHYYLCSSQLWQKLEKVIKIVQ